MAHSDLYARYSSWKDGEIALHFEQPETRDLRDAETIGRALRALRQRGGAEMGHRPLTSLLREARVFSAELPSIQKTEFKSARDIARVLFQ